MLDPLKKINKNKMYIFILDPSIKFFSLHGNGDTIRIGRDI